MPTVYRRWVCFKCKLVYLNSDKDGVADTTESSAAHLYASGRLSGINTATTAYTITYDTFGNMVSVSAGGNVLATYIIAFAVLLDCSPSSDMHSSFNQFENIIGNYISITQFIYFNMGSAGIDILCDTKERISVW